MQCHPTRKCEFEALKRILTSSMITFQQFPAHFVRPWPEKLFWDKETRTSPSTTQPTTEGLPLALTGWKTRLSKQSTGSNDLPPASHKTFVGQGKLFIFVHVHTEVLSPQFVDLLLKTHSSTKMKIRRFVHKGAWTHFTPSFLQFPRPFSIGWLLGPDWTEWHISLVRRMETISMAQSSVHKTRTEASTVVPCFVFRRNVFVLCLDNLFSTDRSLKQWMSGLKLCQSYQQRLDTLMTSSVVTS